MYFAGFCQVLNKVVLKMPGVIFNKTSSDGRPWTNERPLNCWIDGTKVILSLNVTGKYTLLTGDECRSIPSQPILL